MKYYVNNGNEVDNLSYELDNFGTIDLFKKIVKPNGHFSIVHLGKFNYADNSRVIDVICSKEYLHEVKEILISYGIEINKGKKI